MGDAYDRLMLELVLSALVLGESAVELRSALAELTRSSSGSGELAAGVVEHSAVGLRSEPQACWSASCVEGHVPGLWLVLAGLADLAGLVDLAVGAAL
ncbi:hypothetical protein [Streptomyces noursei]|uniref:hypothetical protein n=1 Tax=Streptomyces noursei TaxID=1971 RepID=UPI00382A87E2